MKVAIPGRTIMNLRDATRNFIFAALVICSNVIGASANGQEKIRLGHSSIGATNGSFWVADEKGLFKKHGVDVEVIFIGGCGARVVSALFPPAPHFSADGGA